jgi:hypothetical protein
MIERGFISIPRKIGAQYTMSSVALIEQTQIPLEIPATATPCTVVQQGQFLFQGTAPMLNEPITPTTPSSYSSFHDFLASMPAQAWVFDNVQLKGSIEAIVQAIRSGTCSCITDGSYKDHHGTAAWKIIDLDNLDHSIEGQVVTPGHPYQQEAYRSELSGLYASVAVINALTDFFSIMEGSITLACDNLLACQMSSYDALGTNPSSCTQFDLVMAIQHIKLLS